MSGKVHTKNQSYKLDFIYKLLLTFKICNSEVNSCERSILSHVNCHVSYITISVNVKIQINVLYVRFRMLAYCECREIGVEHIVT